MIKIICVGKIKEKFYVQALNEYIKRLSKYTKLEIFEIDDESNGSINQIIDKESNKILDKIKDDDYTILLDINGISLSSEDLADRINKLSWQHKNLVFIIGGSYGVNGEVKEKAKVLLSFSKLTFPHQLFRLILAEQLYRSFTIINGTPYHK